MTKIDGQPADVAMRAVPGRGEGQDDHVDDEDERQDRPGQDQVVEALDQVVAGDVDLGGHAFVLSLGSSVARPAAWTMTCCSDRGSRLRCSSRARAQSPSSSVPATTTDSCEAIRRRSQVRRPGDELLHGGDRAAHRRGAAADVVGRRRRARSARGR